MLGAVSKLFTQMFFITGLRNQIVISRHRLHRPHQSPPQQQHGATSVLHNIEDAHGSLLLQPTAPRRHIVTFKSDLAQRSTAALTTAGSLQCKLSRSTTTDIQASENKRRKKKRCRCTLAHTNSKRCEGRARVRLYSHVQRARWYSRGRDKPGSWQQPHSRRTYGPINTCQIPLAV